MAFVSGESLNILHTEWSEGWGGQEQRIVLESRLLKKRGHPVVLACRPTSQIFYRAHQSGITTIPVPFSSSFHLPSIRIIKKILKEERIDVVVSHSSIDSWIVAASVLGGKIAWVRTRHLSIPPSRNPLSRIVYRRPHRVVTTAEAITELLIRQQSLSPERVISIPTGVDLERFEPTISGRSVRAESGISECTPLILYAAVLRSWKRHDLVLEAFKTILSSIPDCRLLFAGEGPQRKNIERLIQHLDLKHRVILLGHREDLPEVIAAADLCLLASDRGEGVPQVVTQYLAMKKPVIATEVGGVPELITSGVSGWMILPGSVPALVSAIQEWYEKRADLSKMGEEGRRVIEARWSAEIMTDRVEKLYRESISSETQ